MEYRVTVGMDGSVTRSEITGCSGSLAHHAATCHALSNARFEPARDDKGNPAAGHCNAYKDWLAGG